MPIQSPQLEFDGMIGLLATLERKMIAMRVKMGLRTSARNGLWHGGPVPYGYTYDAETGKLVANPEEAAVVRTVYETYAEVGKIHAVKEVLRRDELRDRRGAPWGVPALRNLLRRRLNAGTLSFAGVEVEDPALATVPRDLYERCQGALEAEKVRNEDSVPSDAVVHAHMNKEASTTCPRCGGRQTVRRKGLRVLADGRVRRRYWCRACDAEFRDGTADVEVPPGPDCGCRDKVQ